MIGTITYGEIGPEKCKNIMSKDLQLKIKLKYTAPVFFVSIHNLFCSGF